MSLLGCQCIYCDPPTVDPDREQVDGAEPDDADSVPDGNESDYPAERGSDDVGH